MVKNIGITRERSATHPKRNYTWTDYIHDQNTYTRVRYSLDFSVIWTGKAILDKPSKFCPKQKLNIFGTSRDKHWLKPNQSTRDQTELKQVRKIRLSSLDSAEI